MNKMMRILVLVVLVGVLLSGWRMPALAAPGRAENDAQASSRFLAYDLYVEDGEYIYVAGAAVNGSGRLPAGSLDKGGGMQDIWVAKLRRDGTPVFQALVGGKDDDVAYSLAVQQGVIYLFGETWSTDFPGAPGSAGENDSLVMALAADGSDILWARRLGGSDQDSGRAIAIDENALYLAGITWSQDLVPGTAKGDADGFLARMDFSGGLQWLKVFGGRGLDAPFGIAVGQGSVWVTGETLSPNLAGAPLGGGDVFALSFDPAGVQQFAGLYGGNGEDIAFAAAMAPNGSIYLTGETRSSDLPGAKGKYGGGQDGFLMHLQADGSLQSLTYLGGLLADSGRAVAVLPDENALAAGETRSGEFPYGSPLAGGIKGSKDVFLAQVSPDGDLLAVRLAGGSGEDSAQGIGLTTEGVALAGQFSTGQLPYLLLIAGKDMPGIVLPTAVPPPPTATTAPTASPQPTETLIPTETPVPTDAAVVLEAAQPSNTPVSSNPQAAENTLGAGLTPTNPLPVGTTPEVKGQEATLPATAVGSIGFASTTTAIVRLPAVGSNQQGEAEKPAGHPGFWVGGFVLVALIGGLLFVFMRRK